MCVSVIGLGLTVGGLIACCRQRGGKSNAEERNERQKGECEIHGKLTLVVVTTLRQRLS